MSFTLACSLALLASPARRADAGFLPVAPTSGATLRITGEGTPLQTTSFSAFADGYVASDGRSGFARENAQLFRLPAFPAADVITAVTLVLTVTFAQESTEAPNLGVYAFGHASPALTEADFSNLGLRTAFGFYSPNPAVPFTATFDVTSSYQGFAAQGIPYEGFVLEAGGSSILYSNPLLVFSYTGPAIAAPEPGSLSLCGVAAGIGLVIARVRRRPGIA